MSADAVGGVWTYATELRRELAPAGVEVVLAALGPVAPPEAGIAYRRCRLEWQEEPWEDVREAGEWLCELAERERVDVVHLNGYAHAARRWRVPVVVVAHSCVLSWHEAVRGRPAGEPWQRYRREVSAGLRGADVVVAPTAAMRSALSRHYGFEGRCRVIPNAVSAHRSHGDDVKQPLVLGAGRLWDEAKALLTLDAAAARISWPVAVAGDAGDATAHTVRLLGRLDREGLRARMGRAEIFAHPARYEPFGLVVLEAALARCALVLGDIPSLREQWDGAALFVAPGDDGALAGALERLIGDGRLRESLAGRARRRALRTDVRATAGAYGALYRRLCARGSGVGQTAAA